MVFGNIFLTNMSSSGSNKYLTSNSGFIISSYFRNPLNDNYLMIFIKFIKMNGLFHSKNFNL